ncbi:hypothetical protein VD0002_g483 [Verticillium dahliae]|uniref:Uncharacterized protein n=1 Tax=Verticillium dahliae TaxID=27337 RepID=A0AA45AQU0_VERDA|nr:hypothetical protein BJF96_g311 [Verticillium dahliae]PNH46008.1 hypothetical protein VD0004_g2037 [Verticillium dahliae]PNH56767.1 hypothetical protein VD0003_g977 [Verticillium dahliae]PNH70092.1 hypothetical protein VD0002_g483 [Verticillium dahliae]PNH75550.1 hypothetical protein VD0001_g2040 [Verticillium dahliae]
MLCAWTPESAVPVSLADGPRLDDHDSGCDMSGACQESRRES